MATLTEGKYPGEFIATEANGKRSRDNGILISGQNLGTGRVLGLITASGKWTDLAPGASDGSQVAAGVLFKACNATSADATCVVMTRSCELNRAEMDFGALNGGQQTTAIAQLALQGIIVRPAV
jgi:hypothetical protein